MSTVAAEMYTIGRIDSINDGADAKRQEPDGPDESKSTTLLDLPNEILLQIFRQSCEPTLIHACKVLHRLLPEYAQYVSSLVTAAFSSEDDFKALPEPEQQSLVTEIYGGQRSERRREEVQRQIGSSVWLTSAMIQRSYKTVLRAQLQQHVLGNRSIVLDEEQRARIDTVYRSTSIDTAPGRILFRDDVIIRGSAGAPDKTVALTINSHSIGVGDHFQEGSVEYRVFLTKCIPDCLLIEPRSRQNYGIIRFFVEASREEQSGSVGKLTCNARLLRDRLWDILRDPAGPEASLNSSDHAYHANDTLIPLLQINAASGYRVIITSEMLETAAANANAAMVDALSCHMSIVGLEEDKLPAKLEVHDGPFTITMAEVQAIMARWCQHPNKKMCEKVLDQKLMRFLSRGENLKYIDAYVRRAKK